MTKKALTFPTVVRGSGDEPEIVITTGAADREGDIIDPDGGELADYLRNPVVGFGHFRQEQMPVGSTTSITQEPGRGLRARWRWLEGDPFAARVRNAFEQGVLRAASIGFLPLAWEPRSDGRGMHFSRWSLLEWSIVPIPANPEAVRTLKALGLPVVEDDSDEPVLLLSEEPREIERLTVTRAELTSAIQTAVTPLERQLRALSVRRQAEPEPRWLVDTDDLRSVVEASLHDELSALIQRETRAAINALRGRVE